MENQSTIAGSHNIVIQGVNDSTISLNVNGETKEIVNKLDALQELLTKMNASHFQSAHGTYNIDGVNQANFKFLMDQANFDKKLPDLLAQNIMREDNLWLQSLRQELIKNGIAVGNRPIAIIQHFGWLIETFLQKMGTSIGRERTLRRLSFMVEAFQSSLRYLCYIQISQILKLKNKPQDPNLFDFFALSEETYKDFDFLNFLIVSTQCFNKEEAFMPEIFELVDELSDTKSELFLTALYLVEYRFILSRNLIQDEEDLDRILDEYLTALVFWLRKISFLAKYRLASIKDISLKYKLGTTKKFVHLFGELHGMYSDIYGDHDDFISHSIEGEFTFNQSILLFKGSNIVQSLDAIQDEGSYLSLSPLIIDQSVFANKLTQTPEIYYYVGKKGKSFLYNQYKNELNLNPEDDLKSNKTIQIQSQNITQPKWDELYEQISSVFRPYKTD